MILTYKYRIKDKRAARHLRAHAVACNQVWNWCVAYQRDIQDRWCAGAKPRKWPSHFHLTKLCKGVGKELRLHQQSVGAVCEYFARNRDKTNANLKFRISNGSRRSLGWIPFEKQSRQIKGNSITYLKKCYRFFGNKHRPLPESAKGGCFVEDARGRWYVCFHVEVSEHVCGNAAIGIDLGLKSLATLSDGQSIEAPRHFRNLEVKLATAQRSNNKRRARALHAKIKNSRRDFLHKLSTQLVRENSLIAVGNVNSSSLARTRMAKSVYDAGWFTFKTMLRYKCEHAAASYVEVDERFTTQTCSCCGAIPDGRPKGIAGLGMRQWDCSECGASHDRDVNAARNILIAALSAQRPAGGSQISRISTRGE